MPSKNTPATIDPCLFERIDAAGDTGTIQAIVMVKVPATPKKTVDARGPAGSVIDRVSKKVAEKPTATRYLPRLGGVVISASGRFLTQLLKSKSIVTATAPDADIYGSVM